MPNSPNPAARQLTPMHALKWSPGEKVAARRAFNLAFRRELDAVIQEAKERAARIEGPSELWELEGWLTQLRRHLDRKYDYRYSVLPLVFAALLHEGRLREEDLDGLGQDKLNYIRRAVAL